MASGRSSCMRIVTSTSAAARLDAAREFLSGRPPATELVIVAASGGGADAGRAGLLRLGAEACGTGRGRWGELPLLFRDVPLDSRAEQEFAAALVARSHDGLATVPDGDAFAKTALVALGGAVEERP